MTTIENENEIEISGVTIGDEEEGGVKECSQDKRASEGE